MSQTISDVIECDWLDQGAWATKPVIYFYLQSRFHVTKNDKVITKVLTPHLAGKSGADVDGFAITG